MSGPKSGPKGGSGLIHTAPLTPPGCTNWRDDGRHGREGTQIWADAEFLAAAADPATAPRVCPGCLRAVKERTEFCESPAFMANLTVGGRVQFVTDEECYPHFIIPKGTEATITVVDDSCVYLQVDGEVPGLTDSEEWHGEYQWSADNEVWFNGPDYPTRPWPGRPFVVVDPLDGRTLVDRFGKEVSP